MKILCTSTLTPKIAMKVSNAAYGYDAVEIALNYLSDKLDGYDGYGDSFDVSYQGTQKELMQEVLNILQASGLDATKISSNEITYENGDAETYIQFTTLPEDEYTFTDRSFGYGIYVEERYL